MKAVDRVDNRDQIEKLTEEQRDDYFTKLVMGKDVIEEVNTSKGVFTIKYPIAKDILAIGRIMSLRRNYRPPESFDAESEMVNTMASTLDVVVLSGPKWFEDAKARNKNFSFLEVPSRDFLAELYGKAYSFREQVEGRFDSPEESGDQRVPAKPGNDGPVGGGAFEGISSEPGNTTA